MSLNASRLFAGYRALGFVSNEVPLCIRYHPGNQENYVITCVGRAFHVYTAAQLGIKSISDTLPEPIRCLKVDERHIYTAAGNLIYAFMQGRKIIHTYNGHKSPVHLLLPFVHHLIAVDESNSVKVWNIDAEDVFMEIPFGKESFEVTALVHPTGYINKILFASKQGQMRLYNLRKNELVYLFTGWDSNITILEQSPAEHIIAVGLGDGRIILHNIMTDEAIMKFKQDWGEITAISFRTDVNVMVSGSPLGHIAIWNLDEKRLQSQIRDAHAGPITGMRCLEQEPVMLTSSVDNSVKRWNFNLPDGGGYLHGERSGFSSPALKIRFHGGDGKVLIASGYDGTLRQFSTVHDSGNKSFGRVNREKSGLGKDSVITDFESETSRQSDWDGVLAIHRFEKVSTTWNYNRSTMGAHKLIHRRFHDVKVHRHTTTTSLTITSCGNFGLVGYSSGHVDVFNLQSGLYRGSYGKETAHDGAVMGVNVDIENRMMISAGKDSCVKFWKFSTKKFVSSLPLESLPTKSLLHRESDMLALACDDFVVVVVDIRTKRIVRRFVGPTNTITDMTFTADGRKLIVSSMDSTVRTWDLPSERLVDCFLVESPVVSLSMSPTDTYLATTHVDDVGVYLWSNRTLYSGMVSTPLSAAHKPEVMMLPTTGGPQKGRDSGHSEEEEPDLSIYKSPAQIENLLTLTSLPKARWHSLFYLDIIKERNKPKEAPKVMKNAPFFLPTVPGLEVKFLRPETENASDQVASKLLAGMKLSQFGRLVENTTHEMDNVKKEAAYEKMLDILKKISPAATEDEFQSTDIVPGLLDFIQYFLNARKEFNLMWTYLATIMKLHRELIFGEPELLNKIDEIVSVHRVEMDELLATRNRAMSLLTYIRGAAL